jgi:hypothetical protein
MRFTDFNDENPYKYGEDHGSWLARLAWATLALVVLGGPAAVASDAKLPPTTTAAERKAAFERLIEKAKKDHQVQVIVGLAVPFVPEGDLPDKSAVAAQRAAIAKAQEEFETAFSGRKIKVKRKFRFAPFVAATLDAATLEQMKSSSKVSMVEEDSISRPQLASTSTVIGSTVAQSLSFRGANQSIAILDSGVDNDHPFVGITSQACFSTENAFIGAQSVCPDGSGGQIGAGAGDNCATSIDGCDHGTHVAGIAAGRGNRPDDSILDDPDLPEFSGVAPAATLIAVQIGTRFAGDTCTDAGDSSPCLRFLDSDIIAGLEHVHSLADDLNIAAVNMSIGGGQFSNERDCINAHNGVLAAVANLRSVRIATVVASGNDGFTNALGAPACLPNVISVGNTRDNDTVNPTSDSASFLKLLAPGTSVSSSVPGGGTAIKSGTSMAAPQVAGAWALLKEAFGNINVTNGLQRLRNSGVSVTDTRNNLAKARIQVDAALPIEAIVLSGQPSTGPDVFAGQSKTVTIGIRRVNFSGPVTFVLESTFGVTATASPASTDGNNTLLTVQTQVSNSSLGPKTVRVRPEPVSGVDEIPVTIALNVMPPPGSVSGFSPASGPPGTPVTISGTNLIGSITVHFNGVRATSVTQVSATELRAVVPVSSTTGSLRVTINGDVRNPGNFTVTNGPSITELTPRSGVPDDPVTITGFNLTNATSVTFGINLTSAPFTIGSATRISTTVPAGANSGLVKVSTPDGTANGPSFTISSMTAAPVISNFSPSEGDQGMIVTINGSGFVGPTVQVYIGAGRVTSLTRISSLKLEAKVPTNATTGPIKVTTSNGTSTTAASFTRVLQ